MFSGAHEIQEWLKECARRISKALPEKELEKNPVKSNPSLTTVIWTSPLGLPVCQPYRKYDNKLISTIMSGIFLTNPNSLGPVNSRKQMTAFPPNFIHSLDASHMLMSAIASHDAGLTFAAVHDSFWTHASDVDTMNYVLRDAFIKMHRGDLVQKLRDEFVERYKGFRYPKETAEEEEAEGEELIREDKPKRKKCKGMENWQLLEFPPIPKKVSPPESTSNIRVNSTSRN
jgi:DNA-directed RNA polymerase, mitochondrial